MWARIAYSRTLRTLEVRRKLEGVGATVSRACREHETSNATFGRGQRSCTLRLGPVRAYRPNRDTTWTGDPLSSKLALTWAITTGVYKQVVAFT
ncbi:hypothetical protein CC2G_013517 [Coprinopsis cinerea AmutBmut pab1-1]|nr:hypothetical protein CC2G_013517 [Coprinopsis cinerea AmutBmut pab1-1]